MVANKERIYVGGLDPSRGLTVELVASRLCSVDGVEILSINDVAATTSKNVDNDNDNNIITNRNTSSSSIYTNKQQSIIDEDGDLVDTRNFFFLEARSTTTAAVDGDDNDKKSNTNHNTSTQSALDILSKQYNSVKWKGCQLRVESAKPHFLQRLQDERQQLAKNQATQLKSAQDVINTQQQLEDEKTIIKCRRRLRIRKRFGEEAYHVDTRPHSIELSTNNQNHQQQQITTSEVANNNNNNNGGWDSFAFLHTRMKNKRKSQQLKLIERRKKERRLWASSSSNNKNEQENVDELNSLIFLNRGIHIRFNDENSSSSISSMDKNRIDSSSMFNKEQEEVVLAGKKEPAAMKSTKEEEDNVEAYTSSSSSAVSSDSEESTSVAKREEKVHNWSDDSEEEEEEESSRSSGDSSTDGEEAKSTKKYVWSDDEDDKSISDSTTNKGTKKMIDGSAYTAAATVDEFSGGMDFDIESNSDDDGDASYNNNSGDDDSAAEGEEVHVCLEDDITSNIGILSKMFPTDSFEKEPLAASIANDGEENDNDTTNGGVVKQQHSSYGTGLIMQRYDPTKESDKRFEVPQMKQDDNNDVEKQPSSSSQQQEEVKDKDDILSEDTNNEPPTSKIDEEERVENNTPKEIELTKEEEKVTTNAEENSAPAKDIYEQNKLDDIFKQSREGKSSFSLTNMFQTDDKNVYEQDKLESVFKEARTDSGSSGGFSFGFQSDLPQYTIPAADYKGGFSFGFDTGNNTSTDNGGLEENNTSTDTSLQDLLPTAMEEAVIQDQPKAKSSNKKRRKGMRFPESDLDKYEDMFFSLNEGPAILKDLDGMKQNEANQEQWQKERLILTADWKRKVKAKKPTKKRR